MSAKRPLAGIRVLDLTSVVSGPVCTLRLADYGAEVIKVEPPDGDLLRVLGGPSPTGDCSGPYLQLNRAKRTIALDLKHKDAVAALNRIVDRCDVFVANMRQEALRRLGLDAETLRAQRPHLIHCVITGFGPGGPYSGRPAYDSVVQGASGIGGLFELRDGAPRYSPVLMCDHVTGEIAAGAIAAALVRRERDGQGCALEIPMYETMAAFVLVEHLGGRSFDPPTAPAGERRVLSPANAPVRTADGWISLTTNTDRQARSLLRAIGREELIDDVRFSTTAARIRNIDQWLLLREDAIRTRTTAEWLAVLTPLDVPCMPCHSLDGLIDDSHLDAVSLLQSAHHPDQGPVVQVRPTILENGTTPPIGLPARAQGSDTREILAESGLRADEIDALFECGAAHQPLATASAR